MHPDLSRISGSTRAVAVIGYPVRHSLSPIMHNAAFAAAGLDFCYLALEVRPEDLEEALRGVRALNFAGLSITVPHKAATLALLDEVTEEGRVIGAVNTAANRDGRWAGTNTDTTGFRRLLELNGLYKPGMKVVLLGAGGAARAGLRVLGQAASQVVVFNRGVERARQLVRALPAAPGCRLEALPLEAELMAAHLANADLLVNATSVGMHPRVEGCPLPEGVAIPSGCAVVDMIYTPARTRLLEVASRAGSRTIGGLEMLLYQAVAQFEFWTGVSPDVEVMAGALRSTLSERGLGTRI